VDATGSSTAQRTKLGGGEVSRSETRNVRSMCVTEEGQVSMRYLTSGCRPDAGATMVMMALALRQLRIRPAATFDDC
jgi:hypothetical protein